MKKQYEFWLGGVYDKLGAFTSKEDAERGISPHITLDDLLSDFKEKKVILRIEVIEDAE